MVSEYQRVLGSVQALEGLVADLAAVAAAFASSGAVAEQRNLFKQSLAASDAGQACRNFLFEPPARKKAALEQPLDVQSDAEGGWLLIEDGFGAEALVESSEACEEVLCEEWCKQFWEAARLLNDLEPLTTKMRKKCQARAEKEVLRSQICEILGGEDEEDAFQVARSLVDAGEENAAALQPIINRLRELDGTVTYGSKMNEQVLDVLARFCAAQALFNTDVLPNLGASVAASEKAAERRREEEARRAQAQAVQEARRPILELLESTARALEEQERAHEAAVEAAEHNAALVMSSLVSHETCVARCSLPAEAFAPEAEGGNMILRKLVPAIGMRLFS